MTTASGAIYRTTNVIKFGLSLLRRRFNSSKCKTAAKMAVARIKLLRNKRQAVVKQMRRDIALLLKSGQDATARIRVEHVMREQNILAANEVIELFCELVVSRLPIIAKHRECPADLKEGIASLIFASPRCSEIPELVSIRNIFEKKYGKEFVLAATDLRPNCGVNRMLIDKLSVRTPTGQLKLQVMKEIAKEHQIAWDASESETELLKPPEELIEGPKNFVSAASLPLNQATTQSTEHKKPACRREEEGDIHQFTDTASAAEAAAESARKAIAAAQAAAYLASKDPKAPQRASFGGSHSHNEAKPEDIIDNGKNYRRHSYNAPSVRHSYNAPSVNSNIKFDESDYDDDEVETEDGADSIYLPPNRPPPQATSPQIKPDPRVHPKLPDYDELSARFEALKYRKSKT